MNNAISIAKGIAIILMVIGHSGCPDIVCKFIYSFHMPLFFFVSGYLFNQKYLSTPKDFAKRKIKGIYIPFVKWNIIFILLHNVFYSMGIYENTYSNEDLFFRIAKLFTLIFGNSEQLLGGFWFIKELFFVTFGCYIILKIIQLLQLKKKYNLKQMLYISLVICLFASYLRGVFDFDIFPSFISNRTFFGCYMFILGYLIQLLNFKIKGWVPIAVGYSICILVIMLFPNEYLSMMNIKGLLLIPYAVIATSGVLATYFLSEKILSIDNIIVSKLINIGTKTLYILIFHFLALRLVSYCIIQFGYNGSMTDFPVIPDLGGLWWVVYSVVGVIVPLFIWEIGKWIANFYRSFNANN